MEYKYLKEVIESPILGKALPVNSNPFKVCSFNCIFCDLGHTTHISTKRELFYPSEEIFDEINEYIENNGEPEYIWLSGNGEPSLYLGFKQLASQIKVNYPTVKIRVSSNGSLLYREDVRNELLLCDLVSTNLNTLNQEEFLQISRPHEDVKLDNIIQGISLFRRSFKGELWISTIFVKGINDNKINVKNLKSFLSEINPEFYLIKSFSRNKKESLSDNFKEYVKETFKDVNFKIEIML